jgi:hypothetical protein
VIQGKTIEELGVGKVAEKTQEFDPRKEKQIFEEVIKEFGRDQSSSSKVRPEVREYGMPLAFDEFTSHGNGKEVSKLASFLYTFIELIKDEKSIQELQNLIRQYELGKIDPLLNRVVHQVSKREGQINNYTWRVRYRLCGPQLRVGGQCHDEADLGTDGKT